MASRCLAVDANSRDWSWRNCVVMAGNTPFQLTFMERLLNRDRQGAVGYEFYAASALTRRCSFDLYRAAVFFLMMPDFAALSIKEKVFGMRSPAAFAFLLVIAL